MKKIQLLIPPFLCGLAILLLHSEIAQGGRRGGGGGGRGGGFSGGRVGGGSYGGGSYGGARPGGSIGGGSVGGGYRPSGGAINPYGGGGGVRPSITTPSVTSPSVGSRTTSPIVGPGGGTGTAGKGSGSITTKGGATIDYKGAGFKGTTGGGATGGRYVGGIDVTTPGGAEIGRVGKGGAVTGPGGTTIGGKSGTTIGVGPDGGALGSRYKGGAVIGPGGGGVAGKSTVGGARDPGGNTVVGGSRAGIASGPYGAVAGKTGAVTGRGGTYYRSTTAIRGQGTYVRQGVTHYPCFRPGWYTRHPGAWFAAGWAANSVWRWATYDDCSTYCGIVGEPVYYDYGETVEYQDSGVYLGAERVASPEEYVEQAEALADTGRDAKVTKEEDWLPLGVFAMVRGSETTSNHIFQLSVNKKGVIRGTYYDAVTDNSDAVYGSVDPKTQRAAWTVGDRKTPIYEAGIANLTKAETTMMVHFAKDRSEQFTLVRLEEPSTPEAKDAKSTK